MSGRKQLPWVRFVSLQEEESTMFGTTCVAILVWLLVCGIASGGKSLNKSNDCSPQNVSTGAELLLGRKSHSFNDKPHLSPV